MLSTSQRVFDPIGVTSPVLLKPKFLLQKLWALKIGWDAEVPEELKNEFLEWQQQLNELKRLRITRWAFLQPAQAGKLTFHMFVDASKDAYAAALYARTEGLEEVYVQLIEAKARVAPVERTTIP